ncbi:Os08g0517001, partial [Oryza sativa Japonica Group]
AAAAAAALLGVGVVLLVLLLDDGVVGGEERGQVGGGQRAAGRAPPRPRGEDAAALVERVLRLGDLLRRRLRRRLGQARERLGLAGVEVGESPPAKENKNKSA